MVTRGVVVDACARQDAGVHPRMKRLDTAPHDFRETGEVGNLDDRDSTFPQHASRTAGRQDLEIMSGKGATEFDQAALVRHADQRAPNPARLHVHRPYRRMRLLSVDRVIPRIAAARDGLPPVCSRTVWISGTSTSRTMR